MTWFSYLLRQSFPYAFISFKILSEPGALLLRRHFTTPKTCYHITSQNISYHSFLQSFDRHLSTVSPNLPSVSLFSQYLHGIIYSFPLLQFSFEMFSSCFNVSPLQVWQKKKQTNKKQVAAWPILVFNFSLCPLPHLLHLPHPCIGLSYVSTEEYSQLYILAQLEVKNSFMLWKQKVSSNWSQGGWLLATRPPVHMTKCEGMWLSTGHQQLKPGQGAP